MCGALSRPQIRQFPFMNTLNYYCERDVNVRMDLIFACQTVLRIHFVRNSQVTDARTSDVTFYHFRLRARGHKIDCVALASSARVQRQNGVILQIFLLQNVSGVFRRGSWWLHSVLLFILSFVHNLLATLIWRNAPFIYTIFLLSHIVACAGWEEVPCGRSIRWLPPRITFHNNVASSSFRHPSPFCTFFAYNVPLAATSLDVERSDTNDFRLSFVLRIYDWNTMPVRGMRAVARVLNLNIVILPDEFHGK